MLVDDHTLFRRGLAELLEGRDAIRVVAATGDSEEALRVARDHAPEVAIVDLNMAPHGGLALIRRLREEGWKGTPIVLTVSDAENDMANALARALDISHETVKLHVRRILAKLKVSSRVEAAVYAVEQGVVAPAGKAQRQA